MTRTRSDVDERLDPRPITPPPQLPLVLAAFRPEDEGLLPSSNMHQKVTNRARNTRNVRIQLRFGQ